MNFFKLFFLAVSGAAYGILSAAGVFTVFVAVGLVPRFAGRTHTAGKILLYEEMVIFGTLAGSVLSVFSRCSQCGAWWQQHFPGQERALFWTGSFIQLIFGLFSGMFVGCLALAIAEMLDSIPIFTRRIGLGRGLKSLIWGVALGKLAGSLFYFAFHFYETGF